jgi:FKBP-type peptidyl-prolyl cis-trans isomerase FklB
LIKGWQEVLPMMPVGSLWRLWIPSNLAYGDSGAGGNIPGGATLVFDIELLEIL